MRACDYCNNNYDELFIDKDRRNLCINCWHLYHNYEPEEKTMQEKKYRRITIYTCDICKQECGLPYYRLTGYEYFNGLKIGYGDCCSSLVSKLKGFPPKETKEFIRFIQIVFESEIKQIKNTK